MKINLSKFALLFLAIVVGTYALSACGARIEQQRASEEEEVLEPSLDSPEAAAQDSFKNWVMQTGTPYEEARFEVLNNDGTFATVWIMVFLRESAEDGWRENAADLECRKVGADWQCDPVIHFLLSQAEQARLLAQQNATATAVSQAQNATATAVAHAQATETATAIDQQLAPLYQQVLSAYESEDWWLAGYYLKQVTQVQASYRDASMLLRSIETEHPQGHILVADEDGNIYLTDAWGTEIEQIESGTSAALSPSGEKIAFIRGNNLRVGPIHGEHPAVLTLDLEPGYLLPGWPFIAWSPDERSLLITPVDSDWDQAKIGLFSVEKGEVQEMLLAGDRDACAFPATWDPSGNRIAYAAEGIWIYDLSSGTETQIMTEPGIPSWSPDGAWIAFASYDEGVLYTTRPDGSNAKTIVDEDGLPILEDVHYVTWSPDASKLLCASGYTDELWVVDPKGSSAIQITSFADSFWGFRVASLSWGP